MKTRTAGRLLGAAALVLALSACEGTFSVQPEGSSSSSSPAPSGSPSTTSPPAQDPGSGQQEPAQAEQPAQPPVQQPAEDPAPAEPPAQPAEPPAEPPALDYVPKFIGEDAYINTVDGNHAVTFALENVVSDPQCSYSDAFSSDNGRLVRLDIDLYTGDSSTMEQVLGDNSFEMPDSGWRFVDVDGVRTNSIDTLPAYICSDAGSALPESIGPNEHVTGYVVLDIPSTSGTLRYMDPTIGQGWEWQIG